MSTVTIILIFSTHTRVNHVGGVFTVDRFKFLVTEKIDEAGLKILEGAGEVVFASGTSEETLIRESRDVDAIIIRALGRITVGVLSNALNLRVVGRHGVGVDNVDVEAATKRGVIVVYTPDVNSEAVADHTFGLIIASARRIAQADHALRTRAEWKFRYECIGTNVYGKTLGIIGLGRIGRRVAKRAYGFKMRILAYDPYVTASPAEDLNVEIVDLKTLLSLSDFVTIHVPLTKETHGLLGEEELSLMKKEAFLINAARGGVIDESALVKALALGRLAGAALDVFSKEPPDPENPLFKMDNVVVTPHMAAHTKETLRDMAVTVATDVVQALIGEIPRNIVNPEVLEVLK